MTDQNEIIKSGSSPLANVDFGSYAGQGFDKQTSRDVAIPFLGLLQALSPQVTDGNASRIEGAKPGDMFNTVTMEMFPPTVHLVPCCSENCFVEWVPRDKGGGFVAVHSVDSEVVRAAQAKAEKFNGLKTEAGNELQETFYIYGLLLDSADAKQSGSPIVVAFTGSKIKVYKRLMTALRTIKSRIQPPMFAFRIAISSVSAVNKKNQPFKNFEAKPAIGASYLEAMNLPGTEYESLLAEGAALVKAVRGGLARAAVETQSSGAAESTEDVPF
jgi:hypothetical protein